MTSAATKESLADTQRRLLELMQELNLGWNEDLHVRNGEPVFDPPPRIRTEIKFGGEIEPRPELQKDDFVLKLPVVQLFAVLRVLRNGMVTCLRIKHGLPFLIVIRRRRWAG